MPKMSFLNPILLGCSALVACSALAFGEVAAPIGFWETQDDSGAKEHAIVEIYQQDSKLFGKIVQLVNSKDPNAVCDKCDDDKKDQPVKGMVIVWDLEKSDDEWSGGHILDPKTGKEYKCRMSLNEEGNELEVRGYLGLPLLGRTQTWKRFVKVEE